MPELNFSRWVSVGSLNHGNKFEWKGERYMKINDNTRSCIPCANLTTGEIIQLWPDYQVDIMPKGYAMLNGELIQWKEGDRV